MKIWGMEVSVENLMSSSERGAYTSQRGVEICCLCNLISNALHPLQSEESQKGPSAFEQGSKQENIQASNCQSAEENISPQEDRNVVSEEEESEEDQGYGDETLKVTINKWDLLKLRSFCKAKDMAKKTKWQPIKW